VSEGAPANAPPFGLWERMLAGRYLRAKKSEGGVALISIISFTGVTLAVAILIIVMSVMNGFRAELLNKILGFNGHIFVTGGLLDNAGMRDTALERIHRHGPVPDHRRHRPRPDTEGPGPDKDRRRQHHQGRHQGFWPGRVWRQRRRHRRTPGRAAGR
jgi:hypothetical protein